MPPEPITEASHEFEPAGASADDYDAMKVATRSIRWHLMVRDGTRHRSSLRSTAVNIAPSILNKGTAFSAAERHAWGLEGLLPPAVTTIQLQVARRHAEIANLNDDLQKYLVEELCARDRSRFQGV